MEDGIRKLKEIYYRYMWWLWQIILILVSLVFLAFGILVLVYSYRLEDPFSFVLTFFASNLIILISFVLFIGFCYRMITVYGKVYGKKRKEVEKTNLPGTDQSSEHDDNGRGVIEK